VIAKTENAEGRTKGPQAASLDGRRQSSARASESATTRMEYLKMKTSTNFRRAIPLAT
jgi:hypothetical protein